VSEWVSEWMSNKKGIYSRLNPLEDKIYRHQLRQSLYFSPILIIFIINTYLKHLHQSFTFTFTFFIFIYHNHVNQYSSSSKPDFIIHIYFHDLQPTSSSIQNFQPRIRKIPLSAITLRFSIPTNLKILIQIQF